MVNVDPRGLWNSQGDATFYSAQESRDMYDLIEWAGTQPWSNGRVGMSGVSYLARHPEERRVHFHGQGYDMVERPLVRFDETMPIAENMYFALHPAFSTQHSYSWICDDFLLDENGAVERLHALPQDLVELG